ncbi:MAG: hypothetical protein ACU85U_10130 [Gammaproteobacteria bacterium]
MRELLDPAEPCLWLDDHAYTAHLLAHDAPPLLGIADYVAFRRQAAALLASDVTQVALDKLCAAWLHEHPDLVAAMGAKTRAVAPLRALLGNEPLRAHLAATLTALRRAFSGQPLVITLPSPRAWVGIARDSAGVEAIAIGQAEADSASVYVAEFLRTFAECELDGILLVEALHDEPATPEELAWYQPVFNVASHFRWKTGVLLPEQTSLRDVPNGVDFLVARSSPGAVPTLLIQPPSIWLDDSPPASGQAPLAYAQIPHDALPEQVLAVIGILREPHAA